MRESARESRDPQLSPWVLDTLRAPVVSAASSRSAIMDRVRCESAPRRLRAPMRASRWSRRGLLSPFGGMAVLAMLVVLVSVRRLDQRHVGSLIETSAIILGDSVVPLQDVDFGGLRSGNARTADVSGEAAARRDSVVARLGGRLLDTLRVVEFVLRGPAVRSASVVGDFNAWRRGVTMLAHDSGDTWRARVLVPRDALRFAYVVNDAQWISAAGLR